MTTAAPIVKAAAGALLLSFAAPNAAKTPVLKATAPPAGGYSIVMAPASPKGASPAVEHLPKSMIAWEFDTEPDGTAAIKGPDGTIWHGRLQVSSEPPRPGQRTYHFPSLPSYNTRPYQLRIQPPKLPQLPIPRLPSTK